jgi:predicted aspartyl protease
MTHPEPPAPLNACYLHKHRSATGRCSGCDRPICTRCTGFAEMNPVCPACGDDVAGRVRRRRAGWVLVAVGAAAGVVGAVGFVVSGALKSRDEAARAAVADARAALDREAPDEAKAAFERALSADRDNASALAGLGLLAYEAGDLQTALTHLKHARAAGDRSAAVTDALTSIAASGFGTGGGGERDSTLRGTRDAEARARAARATAAEAEAQAAAAEARARTAAAGAAAQRAAAEAEAHAARAAALSARRAEQAAEAEEATARAAEARARSAAAGEAIDAACPLPTVARGNSLLVDVALDGHPARLVLDTGATATVLTRRAAEAAGLEIDDENRRTASTANGVAEFSPAVVGWLSIGDRGVRDLPVATCDACDAIGADGLLGVDVLRALRVRVDLPTQSAHFADCE